MEKSIFETMQQKQLDTSNGSVVYWISKGQYEKTLVFLHGLTADHTLFEKQIPHFLERFNLICWDAPAHGMSRPYTDFSYSRTAEHLKSILDNEQISNIIFVAQSMGGYIAQAFIKRYPNMVKGFVGIDTSPFGFEYYSRADMWWLRQIEWMSMCFPDKLLKKSIAKSCTYTEVAYNNMLAALQPYAKKELCHLMGIGYAGFLAENCSLEITCPALLLVGEHDRTGKVKQYCNEWSKATGFPLHTIPKAAHNANYDNSTAANREIDVFIDSIYKNKKCGYNIGISKGGDYLG